MAARYLGGRRLLLCGNFVSGRHILLQNRTVNTRLQRRRGHAVERLRQRIDVEPGGDDRHLDILAERLICAGAPNDVGIVARTRLDIFGNQVSLFEGDFLFTGSYVDQDIACPDNVVVVQQRRGERRIGHFHRTVVARSAARTHQRDAAVLHHGLHIGEVDVHRIVTRNHLGNALGRRGQNIIGLAERLRKGQLAVNILNVLVVDQQQRIHILPQLVDTLVSMFHPLRALGLERQRHDGDRQNAQFLGSLGDHRCGTRTGTAAHSGRNEDHLGSFALVDFDDFVEAFESGLASPFGVVARAEPLREALAEPDFDRHRTAVKRLPVGIADHERHIGYPQVEHVVDGIAAAAAHAGHHDDRGRDPRTVEFYDIGHILLLRHNSLCTIFRYLRSHRTCCRSSV